MTPEESLKILDLATLPQSVGRLSRVDYANIETALTTLREAVSEKQEDATGEKTP